MAFGKKKDQKDKKAEENVEKPAEPDDNKPVSLGLVPDDILLAEVIRRELGLYAPTDDKPAAPVEKEFAFSSKLYKAGKYTCIAGRGYNAGGIIYNYGSILTLAKDTFLKDLGYLKHFIPYKGTPQPSLTPYGAKFNKKVPKTGAARGDNFKNHPALKGQGTAAKLPDTPAD